MLLLFLTVGYKREDVMLKWASGGSSSVKITENITMSQFKLLSVSTQEYNHSRMNSSDGRF